MAAITLSSREVNQDIGRAKRAARHGPVVITDRGRPTHVLLTHDAYRKLLGQAPTIMDLLDQPGMESIEFDPPKLSDKFLRPADLT